MTIPAAAYRRNQYPLIELFNNDGSYKFLKRVAKYVSTENQYFMLLGLSKEQLPFRNLFEAFGIKFAVNPTIDVSTIDILAISKYFSKNVNLIIALTPNVPHGLCPDEYINILTIRSVDELTEEVVKAILGVRWICLYDGQEILAKHGAITAEEIQETKKWNDLFKYLRMTDPDAFQRAGEEFFNAVCNDVDESRKKSKQ